ncbi:hypothetical protein ACJIZ3_011188 [Penstemon smallii]|uniref:DNA polymerase delta subunit 3 n=1 Tax=Penstemon smallii TaxID=265156 RepID=A0ABD3UIE9_9LAMI
MADIETLGIVEEIQSIVADKLQVVSYKWLSRNFSVSSNAAKSLLEEFVGKYGNGLEVIYSLSGWLKNNPSTYHIRLVSKQKLADAKQEFDENCSIQVYSVQACLPKDPATLWNHEFVQAEDLFKQPLSVDNCLRDNRFCGVSNSFIKRNPGKGTATPQVKTTGVSGSFKDQQKIVQQSSPNIVQSLDIAKNVKTESHVKEDPGQGAQLASDKEKAPQQAPNKKKGHNDKNSSGTGGALASMWGRASTKTKHDVPLPPKDISLQKSAGSADAQICAREAVQHESSDEDGQNFNMKRTSNGEGSRKRRVVLDYSDEEDEYQDAVNLASPEPPKKSTPGLKNSSTVSGLGSNLSFEEEKVNKPNVKEVKEPNVKANQLSVEEIPDISKGKKLESSTTDKTNSLSPETKAGIKDKATDDGPKRRKVLKTRIDERGREVTEVVWEGPEPDTKSDNNSMKKSENNTVNNAINRPPGVKKSPALGTSAPANQGGKAGNKKGGTKDPKQGNILSFFKKV